MLRPRSTRPSRRSSLAAVGAVLALTCLGAGACSADDEPDRASTGGASPTESADASVDPSRVSPSDLPRTPALAQGKGAAADASFGSCATTPGAVTVDGTVTSTAQRTRDYVITISWINETFDVLARGIATLTAVAPGEQREFRAEADVPQGATSCTYQVLRGQLK